MPAEERPFFLRERVMGDTAVVELHGEIDIVAAPYLTGCLDSLTRSHQPEIVLDLRGMKFMDCSGLSVLCRTRNRVLALGGQLRLVSHDPRFLRLLRLTGLKGCFCVLEELPADIAAADAKGQRAGVIA